MTLFEERICRDYVVPQNTPLCAHFIPNHTNLPTGVTPDFLVDLIVTVEIHLIINDTSRYIEDTLVLPSSTSDNCSC